MAGSSEMKKEIFYGLDGFEMVASYLEYYLVSHKEIISFLLFVFLSTGSQKAVDGIRFLDAMRQSTKRALSNH